MIVDDSPVALAFLEAIFKGAYFEVETAGTGQEGVDKALRLEPDLVVTDGLMPDVDGFELIRRLKANHATADIPVVMLTSGDFRDSEYTSRVPQSKPFSTCDSNDPERLVCVHC